MWFLTALEFQVLLGQLRISSHYTLMGGPGAGMLWQKAHSAPAEANLSISSMRLSTKSVQEMCHGGAGVATRSRCHCATALALTVSEKSETFLGGPTWGKGPNEPAAKPQNLPMFALLIAFGRSPHTLQAWRLCIKNLIATRDSGTSGT